MSHSIRGFYVFSHCGEIWLAKSSTLCYESIPKTAPRLFQPPVKKLFITNLTSIPDGEQKYEPEGTGIAPARA